MVDLLSLRITKTSEVSPFVKNCNVAETSNMNKELGIWHRDTKFEMRKMRKDQDKLYRSLLDLCKTKKMIKSKIEDRLLSNNVELLPKPVDMYGGVLRQPNPQTTMLPPMVPSVAPKQRRKRKKLQRQQLVPLTEENLRKSQEQFNPIIAEDKGRDDDVIDIIAKNNAIVARQENKLNFTKSIKPVKGGLVLAAPYMRATPPEHCNRERIRYQPYLAEESQTDLFEENGELLFAKKNIIEEEDSCFAPNESQLEEESSTDKPNALRPKRQRKKLNSININKPTMEILDGKKYTVNVYKKRDDGGFKIDEQIMDTTVDVAKYFRLASHRERLNRVKMLKQAREKENHQRNRVTQFLSRLSNDNKVEQSNSKLKEDQAAALKRRIEMLKMGTPVYGVGGNTNNVPLYIRNYVSPLRRGMNQSRRTRKRSSWSVPSLYLLEQQKIKTVGEPHLYGNNSPQKSYKGVNQYHPEMSSYSSASHLVNINVDKYLLEAAKLLN